ncbi:MAG: hypothetical protein GX886_09580 [Comamonadaceae bacterium]|nr:hypothetical protein [Comamonadaceae bacterium]
MRRLLGVVVDNGAYGTNRMHQEHECRGRVSGSALFNTSVALLACACGWHAECVEGSESFAPARERRLAAARPGLLHLMADADLSTSRTRLRAIRAAARATGL